DEKRLACAVVIRGRGAEKVDAGESVHLKIDEAGNGDAAAGRRREADVDDDAVGDLDVSGHEFPANEGSLDLEPHAAPPTASRTEPPDSARRSRAAAGSMPARRATSATRASPPAA